jgi:CRP/FNR family cyclic AMP-dependent transcriptional regulator
MEQTIEHRDTFPLLRQTDLPKLLSEAQLQELERYCRSLVRKPGATLFRQDEPADTLYVVVDGTIELRARPPGRRVYRTVEMVVRRCTFGDEAVLGKPTYAVSARVLEQARLLALSRESFDQLAESRPDIALEILRCSASCLIQTLKRAAILTQSPADVALRLLLEEMASAGNGLQGRAASIRITHAQLAGMLHLSRETVSRMLGQMASKGSVELARGMIRLHLN